MCRSIGVIESDNVPKSGYIIFFDWQNDGEFNHVGIVERVDKSNVYTIEGNSVKDEYRKN